MPFNTETWAWFKTAPLPVVLSICLTSFMILGTWSYAIDKRQAEDSTKVAVAVERSTVAAAAAERAEAKLDKANQKLDDLLAVILTIRGQELERQAYVASQLKAREAKEDKEKK